MVNDSVKEIVKHKATLMTSSRGYSEYLKGLVNELGIKELEEAALLGAVDAMNSGDTILNSASEKENGTF